VWRRNPVPLYEYECEACHHRFEQIQTYSDPIVRKCPKCGKKKVKKLLSSPAIQFKGSGFYITDYQRKGSTSSLPDHSESEKKKDKVDKTDASSKTPKPKAAKKD
jgi:putative FmdB family regulatory protein